MLFRLKRWISKKRVKRATLKKWLLLEELRSKIAEDRETTGDHICEYLSSAICYGEWETLDWLDVAKEYLFAVSVHSPTQKYPIFQFRPRESKDRVEYDHWSWYMWANLFAKNYGWNLDRIEKLDIDDAISLIHEILLGEQEDREWDWSLSDKSIEYNSSTKKAKFVPLTRPQWMQATPEILEPKKIKINKNMLPAGVVMRWNPDNTNH